MKIRWLERVCIIFPKWNPRNRKWRVKSPFARFLSILLPSWVLTLEYLSKYFAYLPTFRTSFPFSASLIPADRQIRLLSSLSLSLASSMADSGNNGAQTLRGFSILSLLDWVPRLLVDNRFPSSVWIRRDSRLAGFFCNMRELIQLE